MGRFSKADIQFHSESYGREAHAAVDVKVYGWRELPLAELLAVARDYGAGDSAALEFANWYRGLADDERGEWGETAIEYGWRSLDDAAKAIFGNGARVYSEGSSGGWAVVTPGHDRYTSADHIREHQPFTRSEVESWNALAVSRWGRFVKACRETVADFPAEAARCAYLGAFEPAREARERSRRFSFFYDVPWPVVSGGAA